MPRLLLALASLCAISSAQILGPIVNSKPMVAGCSTPTGTALTESFGDSSISCWTSGPTTCDNTWTVTGSGNSIVTSPAGSPANSACANSFQLVGTASTQFITRNITSIPEATAVDVYAYLYVTSEALGTYTSRTLLAVTGAATRATVHLYRADAGTLYLRGSGLTNSANVSITTGTWYKVRLHAETGTDVSYITVNDGSAQTFTQGAYAATQVQVGSGSAVTWEIVVGCLYAS